MRKATYSPSQPQPWRRVVRISVRKRKLCRERYAAACISGASAESLWELAYANKSFAEGTVETTRTSGSFAGDVVGISARDRGFAENAMLRSEVLQNLSSSCTHFLELLSATELVTPGKGSAAPPEKGSVSPTREGAGRTPPGKGLGAPPGEDSAPPPGRGLGAPRPGRVLRPTPRRS